jgi:hypothetical protein
VFHRPVELATETGQLKCCLTRAVAKPIRRRSNQQLSSALRAIGQPAHRDSMGISPDLWISKSQPRPIVSKRPTGVQNRRVLGYFQRLNRVSCVIEVYGAGDGNRTHVRSLGSFYTAIVRRPLGVILRRIIHNCDWVRKEVGADKFILRRVSRTALEWCKLHCFLHCYGQPSSNVANSSETTWVVFGTLRSKIIERSPSQPQPPTIRRDAATLGSAERHSPPLLGHLAERWFFDHPPACV